VWRPRRADKTPRRTGPRCPPAGRHMLLVW